jgi:hypothetical protein
MDNRQARAYRLPSPLVSGTADSLRQVAVPAQRSKCSRVKISRLKKRTPPPALAQGPRSRRGAEPGKLVARRLLGVPAVSNLKSAGDE